MPVERIRAVVIIGDMDDDEMILLMCRENATQHGGAVAAAVVNEVGAIVKRVGGVLQTEERLASIGASLFDSDHAFKQAKKAVLNGEGVGWPSVTRYLKGPDPDEAAKPLRSKRQVISHRDHVSHAGRPCQLSGIPGASFQFGRTSMRCPRAPHFAHLTLARNHGTGVSGG